MTASPTLPRASIVVPAHDEEAVILRGLASLLDGSEDGEWDVVVVANGCRDRTVEVVRGAPWPVRCLDLAEGGKIGALNAGDDACTTFPRIYLDADVELGTEAARALVAALAGDAAQAAAPQMVLDTTGVSLWLRAYYRIWSQLPVFGHGYVGSGVYAVNEAGHRRIAPFPDVVNDDEHVRRSFRPDERTTSAGAFVVRPARTLPALLSRAARTRRGVLQLAATGPVEPTGTGSALRRLARQPGNWVDLGVFVATTALTRAAARRAAARPSSWGRDITSRGGTPA